MGRADQNRPFLLAATPHACVARMDLAVRRLTLPPCTCGYLGGAASVALGRAAQGELLVGRGKGGDVELLHYLDTLHQFRNCASSGNRVIYDNSNPGIRGRIFLICASVAYPYSFKTLLLLVCSDYGGTKGYMGKQMQSGVEVCMREVIREPPRRALLTFI